MLAELFWGTLANWDCLALRSEVRATTRPVISHLEEGQIQNRVQPIYPPIAKLARIEGDVVLSAVITTNGDIQQVHVVSGPPLLQEAALQAIRQWRSRPYILNGRPIEIETRTIRFRLQ
jgi:periplasmic protein TonB